MYFFIGSFALIDFLTDSISINFVLTEKISGQPSLYDHPFSRVRDTHFLRRDPRKPGGQNPGFPTFWREAYVKRNFALITSVELAL